MQIHPLTRSIGHVNGTVLVVFLVLKVSRLVEWPWGWVLCPLWWPLALAAFVLPIAVIVECWKDWRRDHAR